MNIIDFIVCDDIRHEIGNKNTIIGAYDEELTFIEQDSKEKDTWPKVLKLGFFVRVKLLEEDPLPDELTLEFIHQEKIFSSVKVKIQASTKVHLLGFSLVNNNFKIPGSGDIIFKLKLFKNGQLIFDESPEYKLSVNLN